MAVLGSPTMSLHTSILFTVPLTGEWMLAHMKACASAISCPTFTLSPLATMGVAGAPRCWFINTATCLGRGICSMAALVDILFSSGWTPPILNVFIFSDSKSCLFQMFGMRYYSAGLGAASGAGALTAAGAGVPSAGVSFFGGRGGKLTAWMAPVGHSATHLRHRRHRLKSM